MFVVCEAKLAGTPAKIDGWIQHFFFTVPDPTSSKLKIAIRLYTQVFWPINLHVYIWQAMAYIHPFARFPFFFSDKVTTSWGGGGVLR